MLIAYLPLLAAIIGLLLYVLSTTAKVVEVGRCLLWCGTLATLLALAKHVVKIGGG